ncbi:MULTISPECIES: hypothetical protein [unclassified Lacrimispora]|uniref:hypothetical protein n=1 Tax=unclassified Lacrimispora TaxID=2719232 RepID=UPI00376FF186
MGIELKQFISTTLALIIALTSIPFTPKTTYGGGLENSAGGAEGGSSVTSGGDWANDIGNSGIRISLVSANDPSEVVSVGMDGKPRVIDIIFGTEQQFYDNCKVKQGRTPIMFSSTKAQELGVDTNIIAPVYLTDYLLKAAYKAKEMNDENEWYKKLTSEEMEKALKGASQETIKSEIEKLVSSLRWMINSPNSSGGTNYKLNGNYLRDWLLSNAKGEQVDIGTTDFQALSTTVLADGTTKTISKTTTADKRSNGAKSKADTNKKAEVIHGNDWNEVFTQQLNDASYWFRSGFGSTLQSAKSNRDSCVRWKSNFLSALSGALTSGKITSTSYNGFVKLAKQIEVENKSAYNTFCATVNKQDRRINMSQAVFDKLTGLLTVYGAESDSTEETNTPVTEEDVKKKYEEQLLNHLSYILQLTDDENIPYFITKDMLTKDTLTNRVVIKKAKGGSRNMTVFDPALEMADYTEFRILVEPLDWFTPHKTGSKNSPLYGERFYGTLTNIAQAFDFYMVNQKSLANGMADHLNRNTFNRVSWCSMTVGNDANTIETMFNKQFIFDPIGDTLQGYKVASDIVPNRVLADSSYVTTHPTEGRPHQAGWGVQVYWPKPPENQLPDNATRTWDEDTYPDATPGPSPKTTDIPTKLKVVKWYYVEDEEKNTETVVAVKTQPISGSPIKIENEGTDPDNSFWEVNGWSTGRTESLPADNDTTTTYEQYSDSNKGTYAGTEPTILTMESTDPDKVL